MEPTKSLNAEGHLVLTTATPEVRVMQDYIARKAARAQRRIDAQSALDAELLALDALDAKELEDWQYVWSNGGTIPEGYDENMEPIEIEVD